MSSRWALVALAAVLALGAYLRLANLGRAEFDADELNHVYVAQSLDRGEGPVLPSGLSYTRGIDISQLVRIGTKAVADPETGARLPSALFGLLNLMLGGAIAWALIGPWGAVWTVFLLGIYPEAVGQSHTTRFYTYQLNLGLLALYAGWKVCRFAGRTSTLSSAERRRQWLWAIALGVIIAAGARVQITTLSAVTGIALAIAAAAVADGVTRGWKALHTSVPAILTAIGTAGALAVLLAVPGVVGKLLHEATFVPIWAGGTPGSVLTYYWALSDAFPVLLALAPVAFIVLAFRDVRLSVYLALLFAVPILLHSLAFAWKAERYVLLAIPPLILALSHAAATGSGALVRAIEGHLLRLSIKPAVARAAAIGFTAAAALFVAATQPALSTSKRIAAGKPDIPTDWHAVGRVLAERPELATLPLGSTEPLSSLYYWGRVDFTVQRGLLENAVKAPDGVDHDFYAGVPVLTQPESIREHFEGRGEVLIGLDSARMVYGNVEPALVSVLRERGEELCLGRCGPMRLFRLRFASASSTDE